MKRILAVALVMLMAMSFAACNKENTIVGKWKTVDNIFSTSVDETEDTYVIIEFRADGTGVETDISYDRQKAHIFTYTTNGSWLTMTTNSGTTVEEWEYYIEGDTLTITGGEAIIEYERYYD